MCIGSIQTRIVIHLGICSMIRLTEQRRTKPNSVLNWIHNPSGHLTFIFEKNVKQLPWQQIHGLLVSSLRVLLIVGISPELI